MPSKRVAAFLGLEVNRSAFMPARPRCRQRAIRVVQLGCLRGMMAAPKFREGAKRGGPRQHSCSGGAYMYPSFTAAVAKGGGCILLVGAEGGSDYVS